MTEVSDIIDEFMLILRSGKRKTKEIMLGITMPKALFFESVLIAWKPSLDVAGLQKVIPKNISEI